MTSLDVRSVRCPLCEGGAGDQELYAARLDSDALSTAVFSARRIPDGQHFRIVRCRSCGLIRSDPIAASDVLEGLYRDSRMTYGEEIANLRRTYGKALARLGRQGTLLEIGCGSGFVLE